MPAAASARPCPSPAADAAAPAACRLPPAPVAFFNALRRSTKPRRNPLVLCQPIPLSPSPTLTTNLNPPSLLPLSQCSKRYVISSAPEQSPSSNSAPFSRSSLPGSLALCCLSHVPCALCCARARQHLHDRCWCVRVFLPPPLRRRSLPPLPSAGRGGRRTLDLPFGTRPLSICIRRAIFAHDGTTTMTMTWSPWSQFSEASQATQISLFPPPELLPAQFHCRPPPRGQRDQLNWPQHPPFLAARRAAQEICDFRWGAHMHRRPQSRPGEQTDMRRDAIG